MSAAAPSVPNPLLIDLPDELTGPRVRARPYRDSDGPIVAAAVAESRGRLVASGMPWVSEWDDPNQGAIFVRRAQAKWAAREEFFLGLWDRASDAFLGSSGIHRIDWKVPNVTEAVALIAVFAFDALQAQRVRIRCDARNTRSAAVPRPLGFVHEATMRNEARNTDGSLRDMFEFGLTTNDFHAARAGPWRTCSPFDATLAKPLPLGVKMTNPFTAHPASVGETYLQHMRFAFRFGSRMLSGGAAAVIHSIFPFLFVTTASRINDELVEMRANSHGRRVRLVDVETLQPLDYHI